MALNYYEILNCRPSDTIDEIKKSYQALILKHHPDKQNIAANSSNDQNDVELFYQIDEAWKMLRDPEKRKKYDAEMQQHRFNAEPIVHAKIYRNDFDFDADSQSYVYPCRCGGYFVLPDDCIESDEHCDSEGISSSDETDAKTGDEDEIYIECDECSFVVQLLSSRKTKR